jgi:AbrB family looped-hinge helix DNA binding protein
MFCVRVSLSLATAPTVSNGRIGAMVTTMDAAGRLVIPREIRREAAIEPGTPLEVRFRDGVIEIEPQPLPVTLEKRGRFLVAVPQRKVPALTTEIVERTRRKIRRER